MNRLPWPGEQAADEDGRIGTIVMVMPSRDQAILQNHHGEMFESPLSEITAVDGLGFPVLDRSGYPG